MSEYKLIGLDMDGTLLNSKKKITPENMAAIEKAFSQGKEVVLSTGRSVAELREYTDIIKMKFIGYIFRKSITYIYIFQAYITSVT